MGYYESEYVRSKNLVDFLQSSLVTSHCILDCPKNFTVTDQYPDVREEVAMPGPRQRGGTG